MREAEAKNHQGRRIRFKIVEKGGVTLENLLRRSNPWSAEVCGRTDCFPCKGEKGGTCWREGVTYTLACQECGEEVAAYFGESGRNGYSRGKEHFEKKLAKDEDNSVLWQGCIIRSILPSGMGARGEHGDVFLFSNLGAL